MGKKNGLTIYLSGSIAGHEDDFPKLWRQQAAAALPEYTILDPFRDGFTMANSDDYQRIIKRDLDDVKASDIILVEVDFPDKSYVGTLCELNLAVQEKKLIVAWGKHFKDNIWFQHYLLKDGVQFDSLGNALEFLMNPMFQRMAKELKVMSATKVIIPDIPKSNDKLPSIPPYVPTPPYINPGKPYITWNSDINASGGLRPKMDEFPREGKQTISDK